MTTEDELIMLRLIECIHGRFFNHKLLKKLHSVNLTAKRSIEFVQQLKLINKKSIPNNRTKEKCIA